MHHISNETKQKIEEAVFEVEKKTSSELVAVVTQKSGDYLYITMLITSIIALLGLCFLIISLDILVRLRFESM